MLLLAVWGAILGVIFSFIITQTTDFGEMQKKHEFLYLMGFFGLILVRLLKLLVSPLIISSIVYGNSI
jgi:Na+/H+-dicarboxylate symporter